MSRPFAGAERFAAGAGVDSAHAGVNCLADRARFGVLQKPGEQAAVAVGLGRFGEAESRQSVVSRPRAHLAETCTLSKRRDHVQRHGGKLRLRAGDLAFAAAEHALQFDTYGLGGSSCTLSSIAG